MLAAAAKAGWETDEPSSTAEAMASAPRPLTSTTSRRADPTALRLPGAPLDACIRTAAARLGRGLLLLLLLGAGPPTTKPWTPQPRRRAASASASDDLPTMTV